MNLRKEVFIMAFALFSLFFGAGNLILPPFLGYNAGSDWIIVALAFAISTIVIPVMAIYAHARLQGTMMDFAKKMSPGFALIYCLCVYAIALALPAPRTAAVTHEMAIQPYINVSSLLTSSVFFLLVLIFAFNRSKILDIIGRFLTPILITMLIVIVVMGLFREYGPLKDSVFDNSFSAGILEGYQTFDAIGGVVVGGIVFISLAMRGKWSVAQKRKIIGRAGLLAGIGLFIIYCGLIALGAQYSGGVQIDTRSDLLNLMSRDTLGYYGMAFLGILVALACFTTAVGVIVGASDFMKGLLNNSQLAYRATVILGCITGVVVGQFNVDYIIQVAVPALMFIYPLTIILIFLNVLPQRFATKPVFRAVVITTLLFSIPDFISSIGYTENAQPLKNAIPLGNYSLGWFLPTLVVFAMGNTLKRKRA